MATRIVGSGDPAAACAAASLDRHVRSDGRSPAE